MKARTKRVINFLFCVAIGGIFAEVAHQLLDHFGFNMAQQTPAYFVSMTTGAVVGVLLARQV